MTCAGVTKETDPCEATTNPVFMECLQLDLRLMVSTEYWDFLAGARRKPLVLFAPEVIKSKHNDDGFIFMRMLSGMGCLIMSVAD